MIKSTDLRIGNIISDKGAHPKFYAEVKKLSTNRCYYGSLNLYNSTYENLEPIPLTDNWFIDFGFVLYPWGWVKKSSNDFGVRITRGLHTYEVSGNTGVKIEFVHNLQNLYYILTGEELTIK